MLHSTKQQACFDIGYTGCLLADFASTGRSALLPLQIERKANGKSPTIQLKQFNEPGISNCKNALSPPQRMVAAPSPHGSASRQQLEKLQAHVHCTRP